MSWFLRNGVSLEAGLSSYMVSFRITIDVKVDGVPIERAGRISAERYEARIRELEERIGKLEAMLDREARP